MGRNFLLCALIMVAGSPSVDAEIYKWTDASGKVHFSDKPRDPQRKDSAEVVELNSSYVPSSSGSTSSVTLEQQMLARERRLKAERVAEAKEKKDKQAARQQARAQECDYQKEQLRLLTGMDVTESGRVFYYSTDENGNAVSKSRQKQIIEEIKARIADLRC